MNRFWKRLLGLAPPTSVLDTLGGLRHSMLVCEAPKPDPWKLSARQERALRRKDFRERIAKPLNKSLAPRCATPPHDR